MPKKSRRKNKTPKRSYHLHDCILDLLLVLFTGGFWIIWIFVREMRR